MDLNSGIAIPEGLVGHHCMPTSCSNHDVRSTLSSMLQLGGSGDMHSQKTMLHAEIQFGGILQQNFVIIFSRTIAVRTFCLHNNVAVGGFILHLVSHNLAI